MTKPVLSPNAPSGLADVLVLCPGEWEMRSTKGNAQKGTGAGIHKVTICMAMMSDR